MDILSMLVWLQQWVGEQSKGYSDNKHFLFTSVPILLFSVFFLLKILRSKPNLYKLPPSPPRVPIIGNLHQVGTLAYKSFRDLSQKYGPVMLLHLGQSPALIVSSVEMAKEVMKNQDLVFANRPRLTAGKALVYGCTDIALAPYGEYWRQVKKISVVELLSIKRVQSFKHVRVEEVDSVIEKISSLCSSSEEHGAQQVVNLTEILLTLTNNVVSRCALGVRYETAHGNRFPQMSSNYLGLFNAFSFGDFFPSIGWMDVVTGLSSKFKRASQEVDIFLDQVIDEHLLRHSKLQDEHGQVADSEELDVTDILILSQENYKNLSRNNIKAILLDMFIGGSDTSARTMEWVMAELIKNPKEMKKAQDEVRRVVGNKSTIGDDDINQMEYLKCIVKEILRLHPSVPTLIPRETTKSTKLGGYDIPQNTKVFINAWAIHRDPNVWDDAEEFRPERFINNPIDFKGQDFQFIPFGSGRRGCPGISFAITMVEFSLANLLYCFNWELPDGEKREELDMTEIFGLTASKKTPLRVVPTIYSSRQLF